MTTETRVKTHSLTLGIDIGQQRDPTALVLVEELRDPDKSVHTSTWIARHIERLPLGTPYPGVARRVADVVRRLTQITPKPYVDLVIDVTGVGRPVYELIEQELLTQSKPGPETPRGVYHTFGWGYLIAATFTHGDRYTKADSDREIRVGKAHLVSRLQALLQTGRIRLPETTEARQLAQELLDYEIKVDTNANDLYGAFKVGTHDDLVTALGLAVVYERPGRGVW